MQQLTDSDQGCSSVPILRKAIFVTRDSDLQTDAQLVLVVEKDATFQKLLTDDFCTHFGRVILITVSDGPMCFPLITYSISKTVFQQND